MIKLSGCIHHFSTNAIFHDIITMMIITAEPHDSHFIIHMKGVYRGAS